MTESVRAALRQVVVYPDFKFISFIRLNIFVYFAECPGACNPSRRAAQVPVSIVKVNHPRALGSLAARRDSESRVPQSPEARGAIRARRRRPGCRASP